MRIKTVLAALVIAALLTISPNESEAKPPPEGWGAADIRIATEYWGGETPNLCATLEIEFDTTPAISGAAGEATQPEGPGTECIMRIAPHLGALEQCRVVAHEWGHLLGEPHSADPHSAMYGGLGWKFRPQGCIALGRAAKAPSAAAVARLTRILNPGICRTVRVGVAVYGYHIALEAFAEGYGYGKHPSAAAVFRALVRQCHA